MPLLFHLRKVAHVSPCDVLCAEYAEARSRRSVPRAKADWWPLFEVHLFSSILGTEARHQLVTSAFVNSRDLLSQ